jgi:uncharacterized protein YuzE
MKKAFEKGKWKYDFENDIFVARPLQRKYDSSVQIGNLIFDIDKQGRVNGLEVLHASALFGISKVFLKDVVSGKMKVEVNNNVIKVVIQLKSFVRNANQSSSLSVEKIRPEFIQPTAVEFALA